MLKLIKKAVEVEVFNTLTMHRKIKNKTRGAYYDSKERETQTIFMTIDKLCKFYLISKN